MSDALMPGFYDPPVITVPPVVIQYIADRVTEELTRHYTGPYAKPPAFFTAPVDAVFVAAHPGTDPESDTDEYVPPVEVDGGGA